MYPVEVVPIKNREPQRWSVCGKFWSFGPECPHPLANLPFYKHNIQINNIFYITFSKLIREMKIISTSRASKHQSIVRNRTSMICL